MRISGYEMDTDELMDSMDPDLVQAADVFGPTEFANALSQYINSHGSKTQKLFGKHGLLSRYQKIAQEKANNFQRSAVTSEWWTLEARLWDLIHRLYEFRWKSKQEGVSVEDASLEETHIILKWLTDAAPRPNQSEYIQSNRWFVTRENIKMRKLTRMNLHTDPIVTELDPDAPLRQGKGLMNEDEEMERRLLKQVFSLLRIGDVKGAQQVCRDSNNHWRAASLSGIFALESNKLNNNWRRMCFQIARQPHVDRYERAVYGVICGDLDSVGSVCQSWEDQLWAHFNAIYMWKLEEKLKRNEDQAGVVVANFDGVTSEVVLERLSNSEQENVSVEARHPIRSLVGRVITGNMDGAIEYIRTTAEQDQNLSQTKLAFLLRLSVHILLAMRDLEIPHDQQAESEIIREYIHALMEFHVDDQIALYAHHLPRDLGIETYALFLSTIDTDERRIRQLENAHRFGLDIPDIVRQTMKITLHTTQTAMEELYAEQGQPVLAVALNDPLTPLDETQIRAMEWSLIAGSEHLILDTLVNGNIIFRRFLRSSLIIKLMIVAGHLNAVKSLAERIPCNQLIRPDQIRNEDGSEGVLSQHALEYAQHSALWELFASFDRWEEVALQYMNAHSSKRDRLAEKQSKNEARAALNDFIVRAKTMVLSEEGLNSVLDDVMRVEDPESYVTLARIRDLYVPEIILRMHEVFVWGGENVDPVYLDDCFDLAAAVADSSAKLYDSFRATNQLEDYLGKIKDLSILSLKPENLGTGIGTGLNA